MVLTIVLIIRIRGDAGKVKELKIDCNCRKPKPGLLLRAAENFNIDLEKSWMIGDGANDVRCGQTAGCHTILLAGQIDEGYGADMVVADLKTAVDRIVQRAGHYMSRETLKGRETWNKD